MGIWPRPATKIQRMTAKLGRTFDLKKVRIVPITTAPVTSKTEYAYDII